MTNFELFKEIYIKSSYFGSRVSKESLLWVVKNEEIVNSALNKLYVECPTKFPGENKNKKHYLLKNKWQVLNQFLIMLDICKKEPLKTFKYIKWFFEFLFDLKASWQFYMHPTQINRQK